MHYLTTYVVGYFTAVHKTKYIAHSQPQYSSSWSPASTLKPAERISISLSDVSCIDKINSHIQAILIGERRIPFYSIVKPCPVNRRDMFAS